MKHPIDPKDLPLIEARFCRFFDKRGPDDCWPWIRGISGKYGRFYFRGHPYGSHVIAFLLANKRVKGNNWVLHNCDNPLCCNPAHLHEGGAWRNAKDREHRNRGCYGTRNHLGRYPFELVNEVCQRYWAGESPTALTREYGLSRNLIYLWVSGRIRAHGV